MQKSKYLVRTMVASAAFFSALAGYEGYSSKPYHDSGKVATIGIGSTKYEDGTRVKITDPAITPTRAVQIAKAHISKDEAAFKKSLPGVKLSQAEYNAYLDFVYNFGQSNWHKSSMRKNLLAGKHIAACKSLLKWKYVAGKDCSIRVNNCYGVYVRQLDRYSQCMSANQ